MNLDVICRSYLDQYPWIVFGIFLAICALYIKTRKIRKRIDEYTSYIYHPNARPGFIIRRVEISDQMMIILLRRYKKCMIFSIGVTIIVSAIAMLCCIILGEY